MAPADETKTQTHFESLRYESQACLPYCQGNMVTTSQQSWFWL